MLQYGHLVGHVVGHLVGLVYGKTIQTRHICYNKIFIHETVCRS